MGQVVLLPLPAHQDSPEWRRVSDESLQFAKGLFSELVKNAPAPTTQPATR